ncbi:MAG: Uma2 family endonuclease [Firmicutes bacterium]|nr:Uma2 family endonuclease [Bacillota bacterium]
MSGDSLEKSFPSDTLAHLQAKVQQYIQNGAALGVLVDPEDHDVDVYPPPET